MKTLHKLVLSFSLSLAVISLTQAAKPKQADSPVEPGSAEKHIVAKAYHFTPNPKLPNVLLLGDSISIGYTLNVRQDLDGVANVYRPMQKNGLPENCGDSNKWIEGNLDRWLKSQPKWDVIHFNVGLHDLKRVDPAKGVNSDDPNVPNNTSLEDYKKNLEQIVVKLKATGARLVFATTTPVAGDSRPERLPEDVVKYNAAAVEIMKKHGISIDDLYAQMLPKLSELQLPHNCHFNKEGSLLLSKQAAKSIKDTLAVQSK